MIDFREAAVPVKREPISFIKVVLVMGEIARVISGSATKSKTTTTTT